MDFFPMTSARTFGVELSIIQNTIKGECLTVLEEQDEFTSKFKWKFENVFSTKSEIGPILANIALDFACDTRGASSQDPAQASLGP